MSDRAPRSIGTTLSAAPSGLMVTASGSFGGFHSVLESGFAAHVDAFRSKAPTQKAIVSDRGVRNFSCAQLAI